jgi:hypothetical protein
MSDLIKCWRGTGADCEPVEFECEVFGWPNYTTTGEQMYSNTHFLAREEAWENIEESARLRLASCAESIDSARLALAAADARMVEAGIRMAKVHALRPRPSNG